jgi:DNA-binding NarL/FixJ family response regulator
MRSTRIVQAAAAALLAIIGAVLLVHGTAGAQKAKYKVFLSMSYIGNDWQAEAQKMVSAMAASATYKDKLDLQIQVAGPDPQRQIQQINSMVQAGANAIVVYPISPTALNAAVRNACEQKVVIVAYDAEITEPCAYNVTIDQEQAGRTIAQWLADTLNARPRRKRFSQSIRASRSLRKPPACGPNRLPARSSRRFSRRMAGIKLTGCGCKSGATPRRTCRWKRAFRTIRYARAPAKRRMAIAS